MNDIPQVMDMYQRLLLVRTPSRRKLSLERLHHYFEKTFFSSPWCNNEPSSLVYQSGGCKVTGFLGVVSREMFFGEHPIRVAVSLHFMVEPESRSNLAGMQLIKALYSGPQDLSFTDGAGETGRKVLESLGGMRASLYSLNWKRILRPARYIFDRLAKRKPLSSAASILSPVARLADAIAARLQPRYFPREPTHHTEEELSTETALACLPQFTNGWGLRPSYDSYSLQWLLSQADQMNFYGPLKKVLVRDANREVVGWYMYYLNHKGESTVFQFIARKTSVNDILDHLFAHAWRNGAVSISGRLVPRYMQELYDKHCFFNREAGWMVIHSNNAELLNVIHRGDAFLTPMEGEWCLLF